MEPTRHLEILRTEGGRLATVPIESLGEPVPSVPGWTVEDVVRHSGRVHRWVAAMVRTGSAVDSTELPRMARGPRCLADYRASLDDLLAALSEADATAPLFTFSGPGNVSFWIRRQAHEVSIHRMDTSDAIAGAGGPAPPPLAVDGAADAIDEWANVFLADRLLQQVGTLPDALVGRTLHIHGTDDPAPESGAEWLISLGVDAVTVETIHAKGDVALRGTAELLLLALWRRRPLDSVEVIGDSPVAERLLDVAVF